MADIDLFDLLGLAFDPPEKNARQVESKIKKKLADLGSALGRTTQQTERDAIQEQLNYLNEITPQILTPDGKKLIDSAFVPLAEAKRKTVYSALSAALKLQALTIGRTVTEGAVRYYRKEYRLSDAHVREAFAEAGCEIIKIDPLAAFPKFPTNADYIYTDLAALRKTKDPNPNGADTSIAVDLYAFAAYLSNDAGQTDLYRAMDTKDLWTIFDAASRKYSQRNDDLGKLCGRLATAAKTYVFNSEENRAAYERHLVYRCKELNELFATMKKTPEATLLIPKYADPCIKTITNYFPDFEVALAIYNKEAGFTDNVYLPMSWAYTIKCSFCGHVNEFDSEGAAVKTNSCQNCRKALFQKCDSCGKPVPMSLESCPHCHYVFASAALFAKLYQSAETALRKGDFDGARQYLFQAQTAAPGEKTKTGALLKKIEKEEGLLREPINRLRQLIAEGKYQTARVELAATIKRFPQLNVTEFDQAISGSLSRADKLFSAAQTLPPSKKADVCVSILLHCVDYSPALAFLQATAPMPCSSITVVPTSGTDVMNVSWSHSGEQGVQYRLVRKTGRVGAASENDGDILVDGTTAASFADKLVKPGVAYTYSVFTIRMNVYSAPVSKTGILYADVKNCHAAQHGTSVRITWDAPENSRGATVTRTSGGRTVTLAETAHGSCEDTSTRYGETYTYKIFANYDGKNRSLGVEQVVTPLPTVDSFSIRASQVKDNVYKVSWSIAQRGIALRVMVNGQLCTEVKSEDSAVQIALPRETFCTITVLAYSEGKWLSSENSIEVNMYTSCPIDKKKTHIEETLVSSRTGNSYRIDIRIVLAGELPRSAVGFYYTVRTAKSATRWAALEEIGRSSDIQRVSRDVYQNQGYLSYQDVVMNETAFFASVFTIYSAGGREIVSEPQKVKVSRPLNANLFWSVSYGLFDGLKLSIEMSGNRPIEYVPELILCVCDASQFIASYDDKNAQIVLELPSVDLEPAETEYRKTYSVKTDVPARYLKKCKYFLFERDPSDDDNITLRWKQGFSGKV